MARMVEIDTPVCIGCQSCVEICPEVFAFNDSEEKAYVIFDEGGGIECAAEAAAACPVSCITISGD
jgi:ferredoxin